MVNNTVVANHWTYPDSTSITVRRSTTRTPRRSPSGTSTTTPTARCTSRRRADLHQRARRRDLPFTAVSTNYVQVGELLRGQLRFPPRGWVGPPPESWRPPPPPVIYTNRVVRVVSLNRTVRVNKVTVVGHDDKAPVGRRDAFMLDDGSVKLASGAAEPDDLGVDTQPEGPSWARCRTRVTGFRRRSSRTACGCITGYR